MLTLQGLNDLINNADFDKKEQWPDEIIKRRDIYFGMSLHIDGACPYWYSLRPGCFTWLPGNLLVNRPLMGWYGLDYHLIFDTVLFNRYPHEKEMMRQYRFSQYKPFQKAFFDKCIQMVQGAIFQDSGFSISLSDPDDNQYIWENNFSITDYKTGVNTRTNLAGYFSNSFKTISEDPNGLFLFIPQQSAQLTTTSKIQPDIWFISSKQLRFISEDEIAFERFGYRWVVNRLGYFRWEKKGDKWVLVEPEGYYAHMLGYIPAVVAGGTWNAQGFYESWLQAGKAIADDYVIIKSDEAMCAKQASFPYIQEAASECPECNGVGKISYCTTCHRAADKCGCGDDASSERFGLQRCGNCVDGIVSRNPGDRMIVPKEDMENAMIKVIEIPVDANKMHAERAATAEQNLQKALHLNFVDQAQSGVAKDKDMETRYQFIVSISNDYFDRIIPFAIDTITALRNIRVTEYGLMPTSTDKTIIKPTQFQIKTSYDLLEDLNKAKTSGMPAFQLGALTLDYTDKQFGGDDVLKKMQCIINDMDPLANRPVSEISVLILNNLATSRDGQLNVNLPIILRQIARERGNEWFVKAEYDEIKEEVQTIFNVQFPPVVNVLDIPASERIYT